MAVSIDASVRIGEDVAFRELDGEAVVLNLETGMYYGLDAVGTVIWRAVESSGTLRHALDRVLDEFTAERAAAEADLLELAAQLLEKGLWTRA